MTKSLELTENELSAAVKTMSQDALVEEYKALMQLRKTGEERKYPDLQRRLEILAAEAKARGFKITAKLPMQKSENPKPEVADAEAVEMIKTPQSSSIEEYGYNAVLKILYVRYKKTGKKVKTGEEENPLYPYSNVSEKTFNELQEAKSKGSYILKNIARRNKSQAAAKASGKA